MFSKITESKILHITLRAWPRSAGGLKNIPYMARLHFLFCESGESIVGESSTSRDGTITTKYLVIDV